MRELTPYSYEAEIGIVEEYKDERASWESCVSAGIDLRNKKDDSQWYLGLIAVLVSKYYATVDERQKFTDGALPKVYTLFAHEIGLDPITFRRYKSVAQALLGVAGTTFEDLKINKLPERPYQKLSFSHLSEVVTLPDEEKKRLLDLASDEGWPVHKLRDEVSILKAKKEKRFDDAEKKDNEDVKMIVDAFVKIDKEKKILWMHRSFQGWEIRIV